MIVGAVVLTFVITALGMWNLFQFRDGRRSGEEMRRLRKENDGLRRRIAESEVREQYRRERTAYDNGLYDGRGTDALYRQCLRKYNAKEQADLLLGEDGRRAV